ncbi:MAG: hypothetical protein AABX16_05290 [Nanoarchaeota archaeon]
MERIFLLRKLSASQTRAIKLTLENSFIISPAGYLIPKNTDNSHPLKGNSKMEIGQIGYSYVELLNTHISAIQQYHSQLKEIIKNLSIL